VYFNGTSKGSKGFVCTFIGPAKKVVKIYEDKSKMPLCPFIVHCPLSIVTEPGHPDPGGIWTFLSIKLQKKILLRI
jgi:hypothetical protein